MWYFYNIAEIARPFSVACGKHDKRVRRAMISNYDQVHLRPLSAPGRVIQNRRVDYFRFGRLVVEYYINASVVSHSVD